MVVFVIILLFIVNNTPKIRGERRNKAEFLAKQQKEIELKREQEEQLIKKEAQELYDLFTSDRDISELLLPNLTPYVRGVILQENEICYALSYDAQHIITKKKTHYVGGYQSISIRITKGVRYHVGGFRGQPVVEQYQAISDVGSIYVTNKRFIFAGQNEITTILINKIADVHLVGANIIIIVENRTVPLIIGIIHPYQAPVIAAASYRMAEEAIHHKTKK